MKNQKSKVKNFGVKRQQSDLKDVDWIIHQYDLKSDKEFNYYDTEDIHTAILMDIRDELKEIKRLLQGGKK